MQKEKPLNRAVRQVKIIYDVLGYEPLYLAMHASKAWYFLVFHLLSKASQTLITSILSSSKIIFSLSNTFQEIVNVRPFFAH